METTLTKLQELIQIYAQNKSELDDYKKICDRENAQIKQLMVQEGKTEETSGGWVANYSIQKRESMNDEALLEYAHRNPVLRSIIKIKEYPDYDALETLIYKGLLSPEILTDINRFKEVKEVSVLRISKAKEK